MTGAAHGSRARRRLYLVAGVLVAAALAAWLLEWAVNGAAEAPGSTPAATAYTVAVVRDGETLERFTAAQLHSLPQTSIMSEGKPQEGPSVAAVLTAAGVRGPFTELEFHGMGVRDAGLLTLPARSLNGQTILDFNERGTVKVVSPSLDVHERVRDVTAIVVK